MPAAAPTDEAMVGSRGGAPPPGGVAGGAPAARAPDEAAQPSGGTIIDRLAKINNGRLGSLLNQLQVCCPPPLWSCGWFCMLVILG